MSLTYFTDDGSYGAWNNNCVLIDTSDFTPDDWSEVEYVADWDMPQKALEIRQRKDKENGNANTSNAE